MKSLAAMLGSLLTFAGCVNHVKPMTSYTAAAISLTAESCRQFCWSQQEVRVGQEFCRNAQAVNSLNACVDQLAKLGPPLIDKQTARRQIRDCMGSHGWYLATAKLVICD